MNTTHTSPVVPTASGPVQGIAHPHGTAFLGIPFAAPPTGERRFLAPEPPAPWTEVRRCDAHGATPQRRPFGPVTTIPEPSIPGEDTLTLSIVTPAAGDETAGLPVLVWVHGGGYFAGSPASPWYDGRSFARDGVVTVVISYRLGFDGFGWIDGAPLNRGVLDQVAALQWVHENIRGFGGDPARVTIAGQSAGGGSVLHLLTSPLTRGLVHGAISESGAASGTTPEQAEEVARALAASLGITPDLAGWRSLGEEAILDAQDAANHVPGAPGLDAGPREVVTAMREHPGESLSLVFAPVIDGVSVVAPSAAMADGVAREVPLLIGATRNEFAFPAEGAGARAAVEAALRETGASEAAIARFDIEVDALGDAFAPAQLQVAAMFRLAVAAAARVRRETGAGERTWLYDFAEHSAVSGAAAHCHEIPYAFDLLDAPGIAEQLGEAPSQVLADRIHGAWVRFVREGDAAWPSAADSAVGAEVLAVGGTFDPEAYLVEGELLGD